MALTRWDPWTELSALQRDVQELFGRTVPQATRRSGNLVPAMDAFHTGDGLVLRLELPGLSPDQVEVTTDRGVLTVSGERSFDSDVSDDAWLRRERAVGSFSRSISLPEGVDPETITAHFEHGVLELRIPQAPEQRTHHIAVQGGASAQTVDVDSEQRSAT